MRLLILATFTAAVLFAQDDPPSRVARLNWISGDVSFQPGDVDSWTNATINYPLTTGDQIYAGQGGRAELHIGSNAIRISSNSSFGFLNLDDSGVQASLDQGSIEVRLRQLDPNDAFEIDTPNGAVTLDRPGDYRIESDPNRNATRVTVHDGQAEMFGDGPATSINAHQTVWFGGGSPNVQAEGARDDFDNFVVSRNAAEDKLPRYDYVDPYVVGYEDLYTTGNWLNDPDYGYVWAPPVATGWAPYSTGRWVWEDPWGWTWIDEASWGFAPFHYGRWAYARSRWVWIPGQRTVRPVYAPALVAFVGGASFGVSVGWFPLGPREPWIPSWHASDAYIRRANVRYIPNYTVNVNVTNINYVNRRNPQAVTIVNRNDFVGARPVRNGQVRVSVAQLQGAQIIGSAPRIAPERASVTLGAERGRPAIANRQVVVKRQPPPPPVSFQARQNVLQQNQGRPLDRGQVSQLRQQQPAAVVQRPQVRTARSQGQQGQSQQQVVQQPNARGPQIPQPSPQQPVPNRGGFQPNAQQRGNSIGNAPTGNAQSRGGRGQPNPRPIDESRGRGNMTPRAQPVAPAPVQAAPAPAPVQPAQPRIQQTPQQDRSQGRGRSDRFDQQARPAPAPRPATPQPPAAPPQPAPRPEIQQPAPAPRAEPPAPAQRKPGSQQSGEGRGRGRDNRDNQK